MSKEDLELSKLNFEVESLKSQLDRARHEGCKLELEVELLRSQLGRLGTFARVSWPIVSVILSTALAAIALIFTVRAKGEESRHNKRQEYIDIKQAEWKSYDIAVHDATDESKGSDGRISGVWALSDPYFTWNSEYFRTTAQVLVSVLVTGADDDDPHTAWSKQAIRIAAAQVLGGVRPCVAGQPGNQSSGEATTKFLFGSLDNKETAGIISRAEAYLMARRRELKDTTTVDLKLSAIALVVQRYRACFARADLHGFDLRRIDLSGATLVDAGLVSADLRDSDMRKASLRGTDLSNANLNGAFLAEAQDWDKSVVKGANIKNLQDAPPGFVEWALNHRAVEMESSDWSSWKAKQFPDPTDWDSWRASGFALRADGVPVR